MASQRGYRRQSHRPVREKKLEYYRHLLCEPLEERALLTALEWTSTSLSLSGDKIGAAVTPNGDFFASDGFAIKRSVNQGASWQTVTPLGTFAGGAIAYASSDPSIMIASAAAGVLKSVNGGASWFELGDLSIAHRAQAITFEPGNSLTVYAGGEVSAGLDKSTNGGATWTNQLSSRNVAAITIDPLNPQTLYAGTRNDYSMSGGVLKSTDGGTTWTFVLSNIQVNSIIVDPLDPQRVYAGTEGGSIYRSADGAATWTELTGSTIVTPVNSLAFDPQNSTRLYAATSGEGVYHSPDGGATWSAVNQGLTDLNVVAMSIQTASPYMILAATYGGKGFRATVPADGTPTVILSVAPETISEAGGQAIVTANLSVASAQDVTVALGFSGTARNPDDYTRSGAAITIPAGRTSGSVTLSGVDDALYEGNETIVVDITGVANGIESGTQQVTVTIADDDALPPLALSWLSTTLDLFGHYIGAAVTPNGHFFASDGFAIDRSVNQGASWEEVTPIGSFAGGAIAYAPSNPSIMIAGRGYGTLKSVDGGTTWFQLADMNLGARARAITFDPGNAQTVYAGGGAGGGLYKSTNGGETWTSQLMSRYVAAIAIHPLDPQVLYVGTLDDSSMPGGVLKSTDAGSTWTFVLSNTQVNSVLVDPGDPRRVFAGTESGGIHRSTDGGTTWTELTGSTIVAPVRVLSFDPLNSTRLFAATSGEGVYYSPDSGATWSGINQGLTDLNVVAMGIQTASPHAIFATTYGGNGFWASVSADGNTTVTLSIPSGTLAEAGGTAIVTATLSSISDQDVTVNLGFSGTASHPADYSRSATHIEIPSGQTTGSITLTAVQDSLVEGHETIVVDITSVTNATEPGTQQVTAIIADDDAAGFTLAQTDGDTTVSESGTTDTFTVVLDGQPLSNVVLTLTSSDPNEATVSPETLTFTPANWNMPQTVTVTGIDDTVIDGDQTSTVTVAVDDASSHNAFDHLPDQAVTIITTDDDADTTPPAATNLSPPDDATGIPVNANLAIAFNENVRRGSGSIVLKKTSDDSLVETIAVIGDRVTIQDGLVTIDPSEDLAGETGYYVQIDGGAFEDLAGNSYAGISDKTTWDFTTGDPRLAFLAQALFGGGSDDRGTGVAVVGAGADVKVYASGASSANGGEGIVVKFSAPDAANVVAPEWDTVWPGLAGVDFFTGIAATASEVYAVGASHGRTSDTVGDKEYKGIAANLSAESGSENWYAQTPAAPGAFPYGGHEQLSGATIADEDGQTYLYATGASQSGFYNGGRLYLSKLDATGNVLWTRTDAASNTYSEGVRVAVCGGSIYVAGMNDDDGTRRAYMKKFSPDGTLVWAHTSAPGMFFGLAADPVEGHLYAVGRTGGADPDFLVEKWDADGNVVWSRTFDRENAEDILRAVAIQNGRLYAVGSTRGGTSGGLDGILLELDSATGSIVQVLLWGGAQDDAFVDLGVSPDRLHVIGTTRSFGAGGSDLAYVIYSAADIVTVTVDDVVDITPDPRNMPVTDVDVVFSGPIDLNSFTFADLTLTRDGTAVVLSDTITIALVSGSTYRINALAGFTADEGTYELTVTGSGIQDMNGEPTSGSASDVWVMDTTPPAVNSLSPAADAAAVAVDANLAITFSEAIAKGAGNIVIRDSSDGSAAASIPVTDAAVTIDGASAIIDPAITLAASTGYYIEIAAGAFVDLAGNPFGGISGDAAWNFTTAGQLSGPTIVVGDHLLAPNKPGQWITLIVSGVTAVTGLNVRAQLGDGIGGLAEPVFAGVNFAGGIWEAYPYTVTGGPVAGGEQFVQASLVFNNTGHSVTANGLIVRLQVDTTGFSEGVFPLRLTGTQIGADTAFVLPGGSELAAAITNGTITIAPASISARQLFYNNSLFDGKSDAANAADDGAIATDKAALLPGGTATFANYTNYARGINGIMVDIDRMPASGALDASHFEFRVGNWDDPSNWSAAPAPTSVTVRGGAGLNGSDRVTIVWPSGAIKNQWLQITVRADAVTGLPAADVFYFGNAIGESGNSPTTTYVDGSDFAGARDNPRTFLDRAPIDLRFDYNRDSFVDGSDMAIVRDNSTNLLTALKLITVPATAAASGSPAAPSTPPSQGEGEAADAAALVFASALAGMECWGAADFLPDVGVEQELLSMATARHTPYRDFGERQSSDRLWRADASRREPASAEELTPLQMKHRHLLGSLELAVLDPLEALLDDIAAGMQLAAYS